MKKSIFLLMCVMAWAAAMAVPAKRGTHVFTQADGTQVHLQLSGDEWHHSFVTAEGLAVEQAEDGNFYYRTAQGLSSVVAHDASDRSAAEKQYITANSEQMTMNALFTSDKQARRTRALAARKSSQVPQTGSPRIPVILVNYSDVKLTSSDPVSAWQDQVCKANAVSVYQYFVDQSFGKYTPQFDILGPVTLSNTRSYYGSNDSQGYDKYVGTMVAQACQGTDSSVDWSVYDNDGDGEVDVVIVLYAGVGEASSSVSASIWPCQWDLSSSDYGKNLTLDGTTVSKFAVFNELNGSSTSKLDGIGTMCHEFSHCLDLPDFYATDYSNHFGMGSWSLLDYGSYNNDGYLPCGYTAYERNFMGWFDIDDPVAGKKYTTRSVENGGSAYKITSSDANEYYIIENIEQNGWNQYMPAAGLQVTHVCYNSSYWTNNTVNNYTKQGMTIIPADNSLKMTQYSGYYYIDESDEVGDLFPYNGHNELTSTSTPAATLYNSSSNLDKPITEITKNDDGSVSFKYIAGAVEAPVALDATNVTATTATANWEACEDAVSYTLVVNPYVAPTYELILSEGFSKCKTAGTSNVASTINNYMDNSGWSASTVYVEAGGIRLGSRNTAGTLTSPALDLTNSGGKCTVVVKAKKYATNDNVTFTATLGSESKTITLSGEETTTTLVFDCAENATQTLKFATSGTRPRAIITGLDVYSGDASEAQAAPRKANETVDSETGEITVTGITATSYDLTGLTPVTEYTYKVKTVYADEESAWSNIIHFTTLEQTEDPALPGDVNLDGVYDVEDVNIVVNIILGLDQAANYDGRADVNGDGVVDVDDVNAIIVKMLAN